MHTERNNPDRAPEGFDHTMETLLRLLQSFSEQGCNDIPFKGSWTAAQVADHITRSNRSIAQALSLEGKPADRDPEARKAELAAIFLDFKTKLQVPDFILPLHDTYSKTSLLTALSASADALRSAIKVAALDEAIHHPAFGEITKLELLYFVLYHTQRHMHQLQHIFEIVENRQYKLLSFLFMQPLPIIW